MKALGFLALFAPVWAAACLNDRDTLSFELRNVDALHRITNEWDFRKKAAAIQELALRAIGGRFDRYPDFYYQMRIDRLLKKPKLTAAEYDDLAVAYDRLGKVDTAIRAILDSSNLRKTSDDKYRFHANYGTFLVHRWIVNGHKENDTATLKQSISEIEAALEINPDSHFGRERIQLALEKSWLPGSDGSVWIGPQAPDDETVVVGLSGIVMMGLGYELPDVYSKISHAYVSGSADYSLLQPLARLRYKELLASGKKPIVPPTEPESEDDKTGAKEYALLRADGEKVYQARLAYMNPRFSRGEHPDTDPNFWSGWKEPPQPVLNRVPNTHDDYYKLFYAALALFGAIAIGVILLWRRRRKKRLQS